MFLLIYGAWIFDKVIECILWGDLTLVRLDINNVKEIIKKDFKSTIKNPVVILVLGAIIILPSLYALLNVAACWDIYGNTEHLEFAIANLDEGATYEGVNVTVGDDLVEELKNNTDFSWNFVSEQELRDGVISGRYAGGIIIPKDFSLNIVSITQNIRSYFSNTLSV